VPAAQTLYSFSPYGIPTAATAILAVGVGLGVLLRRVSRASAALFALSVFVAIWQLAFTAMYAANLWGDALHWGRLAYLGIPFIPAAVYQFAVEMLRIVQRRRAAVIISWALAAQFMVLALGTDYLVDGVRHYYWGFYPRYDAAASVPFLVFFGGYLIAAVVEFVIAHRKARGVERIRIRLLVIALGLAFFGCVDYAANYGVPIYPFGFLFILLAYFVIAQTVWTYDLIPITPSLAANEIINTLGDVLFVCDRDGRIQFVNSATVTVLGYGTDEMTGKPIDDLMVRSESDELGDTLRRRSIRNSEYEFRAKSGDTVELTLTVSPVTLHGEAAGAVIIGRDLRARKRAESDTRRALRLLESTLQSTADGILVVGEGGKILSYNQRFADMWRIPKDVLESHDDPKAIAHVLEQLADPADFVRTVENVYAQPEAESFDHLEFKDGRRFERYSIGRYIEEMPVRVWSFRDVTARFAAEAALRDSEVRYRLLFEQNAAGVCVTTFDGAIIDCNSTFARMLGSARANLIHRNMGELYERRVERDELAQMLRDSPTLNGVEIELRRNDGGHVWVLQNLSLVSTGESEFIHGTLVDISDRKRAEEQIEYHAYHDVLTRLPNRRLFTDRLALSITRSKRSGRALAVLFIDLDHFKTVNDTLGHTAGDELLLEMSQRLRSCIREDDTVARLGGDEFTIILSDLRYPEDAVQVAQKILESAELPLAIGGMNIELSASIGIALYPVDGHDVETLLRNADSAMYRAKESGRNNYQLCTAEMKTRALERLSLESRLRKAIQNDQLLLMYQPQVNMATGRITGAEALVRWNDPDRGIIEPMSFIPTAEESRLIIPLGEWVLNAACREARLWQDRGLANLRMAVNLSARQFQQNDLVEMVRRAISDVGIEPAAIELEITETTAMQNAELTIDILRALCDAGVSIAIDDFGSGYSSLAYLRRFPINAVKIDRSFIGGVATNEGDDAIVSAVIAIARSLKLRVIAEGVETAEQFAFLQRRQCDEAQGFFFSPPMTSDSFNRQLFDRPILGARESDSRFAL
jgi:diguanylate cyclase (GGDEF)-like protein/PAS domain S-box-containing protein